MYKVEYKVKNAYEPSKLSETKLLGSIGEKLDRVIYERLSGEYAQKKVFGEAESAFDTMADDAEPPIGIWQGEFWGKQMISACRAYKYNGDKDLLKFIKESCYRVISHQREDGYLGTYKNEKQLFRVSPKIGRQMRGWPCDWTWNIWCRKYIIWALVEAFEVTNDGKILESAEKSLNQMIDMLHDMGARICETGMFYGQASASIMKPVLILYRITGNKKYLDFSLEIASQWEDEDTCSTKLITSALNMIPIHTWGEIPARIVPKSKYNPLLPEGSPVFDVTETDVEYSGKVYEMQSCFDGLLELYRITGEERYLKATKNYFELLVRDELNLFGSVGFNDKFMNAVKYQNTISELCDVIHFMRLATELHRLTGEARYLDYAELGFINCFLPGVTRDGKWGARGVRAADTHLFVHLQAGFTKNHCCVNNMPRGFFNFSENILSFGEGEVMVNFYTPAKATVHPTGKDTVSVEISEGYLKEGKVKLKVNAELGSRIAPALKLRIPEWSKYTVVTANGKTYALNERGYYFALPLQSGESEITIHFDNTPRLIEKNYNFAFYPTSPYMLQRYISAEKIQLDTMIDKPHATVFIGPVLLAKTLELGATIEDIKAQNTVFGKNYSVKAVPLEVEDTLCAYELSFTSKNEKYENFTVKMCDFASASDTEEYKEYRYTVFI